MPTGPGTATANNYRPTQQEVGTAKEIALLLPLILVFPLAMMIAWTPLPQFAKQLQTKKSKSTVQPDNALNVEGKDISLVTVPTRNELPLAQFKFKKAIL